MGSVRQPTLGRVGVGGVAARRSCSHCEQQVRAPHGLEFACTSPDLNSKQEEQVLPKKELVSLGEDTARQRFSPPC